MKPALFALPLAVLLAACGPAHDKSVAPAEITADTACVLDGMLLADFPGPKAQVFYEGQDKPEFFCDTVEMFATTLKPEQARRVKALFVQDMGKAQWDAPRGNWIDARTAFYVVGGKKTGSMGPTIGAFAQEADARVFAAKEGGKVYPYAEVKPDMAVLDGGVLHDQRM